MHNLKRAEAIINRSNPVDLDLLVLPEMAFTGL
jgi:protein N-terminal amidase